MNKTALIRQTMRVMQVWLTWLAIGVFIMVPFRPSLASDASQFLFVLDSSSSMEDDLSGDLKYKLVRKSLYKALSLRNDQLHAGLITFGHSDRNSCKDVKQLLPIEKLDSQSFLHAVERLRPTGKSPISAALSSAASLAKNAKNGVDIILIADGGDNCGANICSSARLMAQHVPQTKIHVIGIGKSGFVKQLSCVAKATGGRFEAIGDTTEMTTALNRIFDANAFKSNVVAKKSAAQNLFAMLTPPAPKRRPPHKIGGSFIPPVEKAPVTVAKTPSIPRSPEPIAPQHTSSIKTEAATGKTATTKAKTSLKNEKSPPPQVLEPVTPKTLPVAAKAVAAKTLAIIPKSPHESPHAAEKKMAAAVRVAQDLRPSIQQPVAPAATPFSQGDQETKVQQTKNLAPIALRALITNEGGEIKSGLVWRVFSSKKDGSSHYKLIKTARAPQFDVSLPLGVYLVNLSWGRSHLTEKLDILSSKPFTHKFILNAGGLRLGAKHMNGSRLPAQQIRYQVFSDERDQFGKRRIIIDNAVPNKIIRLNAGIYHVTSLYGTANGLVSSDITVEAGKLTIATINHTASKVTFKLVNTPGGEALAGAHWRILSPDGKLIKEAGGALPTHVLAAGDYTIHAKYAGRTFARKITIEPGDPVHVEIVIQ